MTFHGRVSKPLSLSDSGLTGSSIGQTGESRDESLKFGRIYTDGFQSHGTSLQPSSMYRLDASDIPGARATSSVAPFATAEEFDGMVDDLRRTFIGWLKKTESQLRRERDALIQQRNDFDEERKKAWQQLLQEKEEEYAKIKVTTTTDTIAGAACHDVLQ
eukprot:GHVT01002058.1.p2 GENE.GHVT01002058.1~~GHVT01002058.1.p2  ORF type:complete len:160 (-),score=15.15 GHVT01002058.1:1743-2222(-)